MQLYADGAFGQCGHGGRWDSGTLRETSRVGVERAQDCIQTLPE